MIDYTLFGTYNRYAICIISKHINNTFFKSSPEKGWQRATIYSNGSGIKIYANKNKLGEFYKIILAFSPHVQSNNSLHNANFLSYTDAKNQVKKTFNSLGIDEDLFKEFYISSIELGVNFPVQMDAEYVLNSALMHSNRFFVIDPKLSYYKFAENPKDKYLKVKFYIKSKQRNNVANLTYHELGYCPNNIMRFEIKLQKGGKFKFIDFSNMESLFADNAEQILLHQLIFRFDEMFFFHTKEIKNRNLTIPQLKKYYQYNVNGYWQSLNTRKLGFEKKYYNEKMPQKNNIKNELRKIIFSNSQQKTMSKFLSK